MIKATDEIEAQLHDNLEKHFGYTEFKSDLQKRAVKCAVKSKLVVKLSAVLICVNECVLICFRKTGHICQYAYRVWQIFVFSIARSYE